MLRLTAAILATAALAASPALAQNFVAQVKTGDLNLQSERGVKKALARVQSAAEGACTDRMVGSRMRHVDEQCVAEVSAALIKRMNAPMVQAAYDAKKTQG